MDKNKEEVEIDLLELGKKLWDKKKFIIKYSIIGAVVGIVIAFSIPKEYTTTVIFTTDSKTSVGGNLGSLATLAGVNISNAPSGDAFASPDLYPDITQSTPFILDLSKVNIRVSDSDIDMPLSNYISDGQNNAWWSYIIGFPFYVKDKIFSAATNNESNESANYSFSISETELKMINNIRKRIYVETDKKSGITSVSITMQDPKVSAYIADTIIVCLESHIIEYRTKKARRDLEYAETLYDIAKLEYYNAQQKLAEFSDANRNVVSAQYRINQERLLNEVNLTYSIYNQTAQQLEIARIKVQDTTPVLAIIQPAIEPIYPSPNKKMIVSILLLLATFSASLWSVRYELCGVSNN